MEGMPIKKVDTYSIQNMKFSASPILSVNVPSMNMSNLPKFIETIKYLSKTEFIEVKKDKSSGFLNHHTNVSLEKEIEVYVKGFQQIECVDDEGSVKNLLVIQEKCMNKILDQ